MSRPAERPRVLQVLQPHDGGVAQHVVDLSLGLVERGFDVEVAAPSRCTALPPLREAGLVTHPLELARAPAPADLSCARRLRALDRSRRYAIVHAHSSKAGAIVRGALPGRRRLVYTPHCFAFAAAGEASAAGRAMYWAAEQLLVPRTAALVAVSDWEADVAHRRLRGARSRVTTIHNGTRPCEAAEPDPELRSFAGDAPLALLLSKLRPQKDPLALVRAAATLDADGRLPGKVAIVGDGELESAVRGAIEQLGVGHVVRWFPFSGSPAPYLAAADLVVAPSRWESLPIGLLDAMACGLPVLATAVGGVPEIVVDGVTGELVPAGDERALADALAALLGDRERRDALGAAGAGVANERFRLDTMVDRTAERYEQLLR